jgi:hypothetical protein
MRVQVAFLIVFGLAALSAPLSFADSGSHQATSIKAAFIERVLGWMSDPACGNGQFPRIDHFGNEPGQIALDDLLERWWNDHAHSNFFDTPEQMYLEIKPLAEQRGLRPRLLHLPLTAHQQLLPELRQEAHEMVLAWMRKHSSHAPYPLDFGRGPDQIPIDYMRLLGRGPFARGESHHHLALFESEEQFWREHQRFASIRGVEFKLIDISFTKPLSFDTRQIIKQEALDRIVQWMFDPNQGAGVRPEPHHFKDRGGSLPVSFQRLTARGKYARGALARHASIFPSVGVYELALTERLARITNSIEECMDLLPGAD